MMKMVLLIRVEKRLGRYHSAADDEEIPLFSSLSSRWGSPSAQWSKCILQSSCTLLLPRCTYMKSTSVTINKFVFPDWLAFLLRLCLCSYHQPPLPSEGGRRHRRQRRGYAVFFLVQLLRHRPLLLFLPPLTLPTKLNKRELTFVLGSNGSPHARTDSLLLEPSVSRRLLLKSDDLMTMDHIFCLLTDLPTLPSSLTTSPLIVYAIGPVVRWIMPIPKKKHPSVDNKKELYQPSPRMPLFCRRIAPLFLINLGP